MEFIWFFLWTLLWAVYFILDGFDLGMGTLMPFLASNDKERRIIYGAQGPYWDGNEVWLITAGGVTFAAFPTAYAVLFSALYAPLLLLLFCLIFRGVSFEFRDKYDSKVWRLCCDFAMTLGSFLPALLLGVAFANLFMGIPIDKEGVYHGNLFMLLNPYGLAGGLLFVLMFCYHGALWLELKSYGNLQAKSKKTACILWTLLLCITLIFLTMTARYTNTYNNIPAPAYMALVLAIIGLIGSRLTLASCSLVSWIFSAIFILGVTFFGVFGMYPGIILSCLDPAATLTIYNSCSSPLTLKIMLGVALTAVPIVIIYQAWVYVTFSQKVNYEDSDVE